MQGIDSVYREYDGTVIRRNGGNALTLALG